MTNLEYNYYEINDHIFQTMQHIDSYQKLNDINYIILITKILHYYISYFILKDLFY